MAEPEIALPHVHYKSKSTIVLIQLKQRLGGVTCRQYDIVREDGRKAFSVSEDNQLTLVSYGQVRRGRIQGAAKGWKLGSYEERKRRVEKGFF